MKHNSHHEKSSTLKQLYKKQKPQTVIGQEAGYTQTDHRSSQNCHIETNAYSESQARVQTQDKGRTCNHYRKNPAGNPTQEPSFYEVTVNIYLFIDIFIEYKYVACVNSNMCFQTFSISLFFFTLLFRILVQLEK